MSELIYADLWEAVARSVPERTAQIRGPRSISWLEFDQRADSLARHFLDTGLGQRARVGAFLYNAPEYIETYFAAFKAGLTPFNINYRYGSDELIYLLDNADAEAVVFHASFAPVLERVRERVPRVRSWVAVPEPGVETPSWALDYESIASQVVGHTVAPWGRSSDDLLMMYTGGTTGLPKGVLWRQADLFAATGSGANLLAGLGPLASAEEAGSRARAYGAGELPGPSIGVSVAPLMHATGQFIALNMLVASGTLVTLPSTRFDAVELWSEVARLRASQITIVGMAFAVPMLEALSADPGRWELTCLRRIVSSGTIWSAENKRGLLSHLPEVILFDMLGASEAIGLGFSATGTGAQSGTARFMVGANTAVFTEDGRRVKPGSSERGLLANGGAIPLGYHKDPQKTAQTFRTFEGTRWSVPGDWAMVAADGEITLLGRGSQVINTGGEKVFPEEVEEVLKLHASVRDAAVVGVPDSRFGECICAVVELRPGASATLAELSAHVKASLAGFKAPRQLVLAKVARQPNGKLDYASIRQRALEAVRG